MPIRTAVAALLAIVALPAVVAQTDLSGPPPWDPADVTLTSRQLAPGGHAVLPDDVGTRDHVATTAGFVVGDRAVLVVESMVNGRLAAELLGLSGTSPTSPSATSSTPSYHGDHSFGNYVFPAEAAVVQHQRRRRTSGVVRARPGLHDRPVRGRPGMEEASRTADVVVADSLVRIDLGGGPSRSGTSGSGRPRATYGLCPPARVLWTGNAVEGAPPPPPVAPRRPSPKMAATLRRVRASCPTTPRSCSATTPRPDRGPRLRGRVPRRARRRGFRGSRRRPHSNETIARVRLPTYGGYSMFGLAHDQINVPAVYDALTPDE